MTDFPIPLKLMPLAVFLIDSFLWSMCEAARWAQAGKGYFCVMERIFELSGLGNATGNLMSVSKDNQASITPGPK